MTLNLSMPGPDLDLKPRLLVIGVGGAGGNAVNNMIRSNLEGVEFLVTNTDAQALNQSLAERKLQLGVGITQGLGAGARPEVGRASAEEALEEILDHLNGCHMTFITAGMGGGTGTGAGPVIAQAARERGILTVGVVTKPFHFEGTQRMRIAEAGIEELQSFVDTLIIIPNQNLFRVANEKTTFADAFKMADDVLYSGVRGVTDLMVMPGLINLDFADIRTVMSEMGKAMMGTGEAEGDKRAIHAAESAISNPLLDDVTMRGARGVLINITGGPDMTLFEVDEAANRIREEVDEDANIIFGSTFDGELEGLMRVSVVATGIDASAQVAPRPVLTGYPTAGAAARESHNAMPEIGETEPAEHEPAPVVEAEAEPEASPEVPPQPATAPEDRPLAQAEAEPNEEPLTMQPEQPMTVAEPAPAPELEPKLEPKLEPEPVERPQLAAAVAGPSEMEAPAPAEEPQPRPDLASAAEQAAVGRETFIPPRPAMPDRRLGTTPVADSGTESDPAGPALDRLEVRRPSLFERVTRTGRARKDSATDIPDATSQAEPAPAPEVRETSEPRLGGVDRPDAPTSTRADEDMLEIPAFLRRQAN